MNKVVLTTLTLSAAIVISGCSSSGSHRSKQGGYYAHDAGYSNQHGRSNSHSNNNSGAIVKVAGALLVGGLIYNALDDDDDNNSHSK